MKNNIYIFFLFSTILTFSQEIVVVDSLTEESIPYANIKLLNEDKGTYSDKRGRFSLKGKENDSVQISCLGYFSIVKPINQLKDTIYLVPKVEELEEIIVNNRPDRVKKVGFKKQNFRWVGEADLQLAQYLKPIKKYENSKINKIYIPVKKQPFFLSKERKENPNYNSIIKVTLFNVKNKLPYKRLISKPILIHFNQDSNKTIELDIADDFIKFNSEGIFIMIEIVGEIDKEGQVVEKDRMRPDIVLTDKSSKAFSESILLMKIKSMNEWISMEENKAVPNKSIYIALRLELVGVKR